MKLFRADCRRGAVMVMTGLAALFLLGMVAIVTDIGYVYYQQNRLQTAVNAGWLAGFDTLVGYKSSGNLNAAAEANIKAQIKEVIMSNGFSEKELEDLEINVRPNKLEVNAKLDVGLFFARVLNVNSQEVFAARGDGRGEDNVAMAPLAIPHGVVKDLAKKSYACSFFEDDDGFREGMEYILKLGEGNKQDPGADEVENFDPKVYIPLGPGKQYESTWAASGRANGVRGWDGGFTASRDFGYEKAYGLAFWCLRIEDGEDLGYIPVEWLLDEEGGGFLLPAGPKGSDGKYAVAKKAEDYGFRMTVSSPGKGEFQLIAQEYNNIDDLNALYRKYSGNIIRLYKRPRIAIYSTAQTDPVIRCLKDAKIPFGDYSLPTPTGWKRNQEYEENKCTVMHDDKILAEGELDKYHWVHLHHEDFTGGGQGCSIMGRKARIGSSYQVPTCYKMIFHKEIPATEEGLERLCSYCRSKLSLKNGKFYCEDLPFIYKSKGELHVDESKFKSYAENDCQNQHKRCIDIPFTCADRTKVLSSISKKYKEYFNDTSTPPWYCGSSVNGAETGCKAIWKENQLARARGYKDDLGAFFKVPYKGYRAFGGWQNDHKTVSDPVPLYDKSWFGKATAGQKSKFMIVNMIREHVLKGGFLYAQCFACETLDMALTMSDVYEQFVGDSIANLTDKEVGVDLQHQRTEAQVESIMEVKNNKTKIKRAYDKCLMFHDFTYTAFPSGEQNRAAHYSSVPIQRTYGSSYGGNYEPGPKITPILNSVVKEKLTYCQTHGPSEISTCVGANCGFRKELLKGDVKILGSRYEKNLKADKEEVRYITHNIASGTVTFLGGHPHANIATRRLFLNNILLGSLVDKEVDVIALPDDMIAKNKCSYGPVDPSNDKGGANNYRDRLINGFFQALTLSDYIVPEYGNMVGPTDQAVEARIASNTRRIIVPITTVPDDVRANNKQNEDAQTIYDLQGNDNPKGVYDPTQYNFGSAVKIIGFAEFELLDPSEYTRVGESYHSGDFGDLGYYYGGQMRGKFIRYIVKPGELDAAIPGGG